MKIRLDISYKGTNYFGWQVQPDKPTVQETLELAIKTLFKTEFKTQGSGRTDAGTHAYQQVVDFDITTKPEIVTKIDSGNFDIKRGLNRFLPPDIRIKDVYLVPADFNSLKSAVSKTYLYKLNTDSYADPLKADLTYWIRGPLDLDYLNEITSPLIGLHDFSSFQTAGTQLATTTREVFSANWLKGPESEVWFKITGSGFLKQMVRNIVGTLLDGHWKKAHTAENIKQILAARSRPQAGSTAPAHGLYLYEVKYPSDLDKKCLKS